MISRLAHSLKDAAAHVSSALVHHANANGLGMGTEEVIPVGDRQVRLLQSLGEGGYSFVYLAEDVETGEQFALKKLIAQDQENSLLAEKEIAILKKLSEKKAMNIIGFIGACKRDNEKPPRAKKRF